jgi:hypothetical protein
MLVEGDQAGKLTRSEGQGGSGIQLPADPISLFHKGYAVATYCRQPGGLATSRSCADDEDSQFLALRFPGPGRAGFGLAGEFGVDHAMGPPPQEQGNRAGIAADAAPYCGIPAPGESHLSN